MAMRDNAQIVRGFYDAFNNRQFDRIPDFVAPECAWLDVPTGTMVPGPEGARKFWENVFKGFPDYKAEITHMVSSGDWVVTEFVARGAQTGPFTMPSGEQLPATGKRIELKFCEIRQLKNGKFVAGRGYYDLASMLKQLGLMSQQRKVGL